jgi:tRNA threonylcarbamoyladenosine biosynthesis protein TsaB
MTRGDQGRRWRLVIDTSTRQSTVAIGDGAVLVTQSLRASAHRHGALMLEQLDEVLDLAGADRHAIESIGVGTGPGSFTGLRVGLATAKTLAYALGRPIVGIRSADAIARAVAAAGDGDPTRFAVILPAGSRDHYLVRPGAEPELLAPGADLAAAAGEFAIAVDLPGSDLGPDAAERGATGLRGLARAMLEILDQRLAAGAVDDVSGLVPAYVALPRGITTAAEGMQWSPDLR